MSGVEGGRFAEYASGAPSVDAVLTEYDGSSFGIGQANTIRVNNVAISRTDLYVSSKDTGSCKKPSGNKSLWYFSVVGNGINHFDGVSFSGVGWVATMAYNSKVIDSFPVKSSSDLNQALSQMTEMVQTLNIKTPRIVQRSEEPFVFTGKRQTGSNTSNPISATFEYKNNEYGFSFMLPSSYKGFKNSGIKCSNTTDSGKYCTFSLTHPNEFMRNDLSSDKIPKYFSSLIIPVETNNDWNTGKLSYPFYYGAPNPSNEIGRNSNNIFFIHPEISYGSIDKSQVSFEKDRLEGEAIFKSFKTFTPTGSEVVASYYPKNLDISGFKIVNGVAKATIYERCLEKGYVCDYNKPDTLLYTQDGQDSMQALIGGYSIGLYMYDGISVGEGVPGGKFLVLVGKGNKWRYDYLDCVDPAGGTCQWIITYPNDKDPKNVLLGISGRSNKNDTYLNAEAFLNSKKSHFVLNGY